MEEEAVIKNIIHLQSLLKNLLKLGVPEESAIQNANGYSYWGISLQHQALFIWAQ